MEIQGDKVKDATARLTLRPLLARDVMSRGLVTVQETDFVQQAVEKLEKQGIGAAPVLNALARPVGVLSKTDIARIRTFQRLITELGKERQLRVKDVMSPQKPVCVLEEEPLMRAVALMAEHDIHHVFVMDGGARLCGVISAMDIVRLLAFSDS